MDCGLWIVERRKISNLAKTESERKREGKLAAEDEGKMRNENRRTNKIHRNGDTHGEKNKSFFKIDKRERERT